MPMQPIVRRLLGAVSADQTRLGRMSGAESRSAEVLRKERRVEGRGIMDGKGGGREPSAEEPQKEEPLIFANKRQ
jgi:hypothetical protein